MSRHEGSKLIATLSVDFSTTGINNTTGTAFNLVLPGGGTSSTLPNHVTRVDITNTAADGVQILANASVVAQIGQAAPAQQTFCFMNKGQSITLKSILSATLAAGRIFISFYV
jgi:hypothetical protein